MKLKEGCPTKMGGWKEGRERRPGWNGEEDD